jgi:hypothetical protein
MAKPPRRSRTDLRWQALTRALGRVRAWQRRSYVVGLGIGQIVKGGRHQPAAVGIVVTVDRKLDEDELLREGRRPFPPSVKLVLGGRRIEVPVDVQHSGGQTIGRLHGLVGGALRRQQQVLGAVGALVQTDDGARVLTAGHVAHESGTRFLLRGLGGVETEAVLMSSATDAALLRADEAFPAESPTLPDGSQLAGVAAVDHTLLGELAFVRDVRSGEILSTVVRAVLVSAPFPLPIDGQAVTTMRGLVACDEITQPGYSGTLLYDEDLRALGTLVGSIGGRDYFVPCDRTFARLKLKLLT